MDHFMDRYQDIKQMDEIKNHKWYPFYVSCSRKSKIKLSKTILLRKSQMPMMFRRPLLQSYSMNDLGAVRKPPPVQLKWIRSLRKPKRPSFIS